MKIAGNKMELTVNGGGLCRLWNFIPVGGKKKENSQTIL